ncbi:MAG: glutathione S-transferase family protein [Tabrizicola sp.]|nr:glutathione S-transferase family protein [Tabrizicola sp.]
MTTTLTLYHVPDWGSSIIRLALEEIGAPYEIRAMDWDGGDFNAPWFRAMNPQGLIPVLDTPEGPMFETIAILLWLNERFGGLGPREGEPDRQGFLTWLSFVNTTLQPTVHTVIHPERLAGPDAAAEVQRLALERLNTQAGWLETLITTQRPDWLSTRQTSAIGYQLGIILRWTMYLPKDQAMRFSLRPFPALRAVLAAHEVTPASRRLTEEEGFGPHPYTDPKGA